MNAAAFAAIAMPLRMNAPPVGLTVVGRRGTPQSTGLERAGENHRKIIGKLTKIIMVMFCYFMQ